MQLCTAGSDAACTYLAAIAGDDYCCANITTSTTGKATTSINGCWSRDLTTSYPNFTDGQVTTTYNCTTAAPANFPVAIKCPCSDATTCCLDIKGTYKNVTTTSSNHRCWPKANLASPIGYSFNTNNTDSAAIVTLSC